MARAIDSALAQTYTKKEILVLDDCSSDNLDAVISNYASLPNFRFIRNEKNIGRVANYRKGLYEIAKGEWALILDGDDFFTNSNYIEHAMALKSKHPELKLIFGKQYIRNEFTGEQTPSSGPNLECLDKVLSLPPFYLFSGNDYLQCCHLIKLGIPHLSALYDRAHAISREVQTVDCIASDSESLFRILADIQVGFIDEFAGAWNYNMNNASGTFDIQKRIQQLQMVFAPYLFLKNNKLCTAKVLEIFKKKMSARCVRDILYIYAENKKYRNLLEFWFEILKQFGVGLALPPLFSLKLWLKLAAPHFYKKIKTSLQS